MANTKKTPNTRLRWFQLLFLVHLPLQYHKPGIIPTRSPGLLELMKWTKDDLLWRESPCTAIRSNEGIH